MSSPYKIHELLSRQELDELEVFAREPGRTIEECEEWLQARGFVVSHGAVGNWKREFLLNDRFAAANGTAKAFVESAKAGGTVALGDAALLALSQMLFEQLLRLQDEKAVDPKDLKIISTNLKNVMNAKRQIEEIKGQVASALAEAEKSAQAGGSGEAVVNRVREILGIGGAA